MKRSLITVLVVAASLMSSCLPLVQSADFDSNGDYYAKYTLPEFLASDDNEQFTLFGRALTVSGLTDLFETYRGVTFLLPTDSAMSELLTQTGCATVEEIAPAVWGALLKYLVITEPCLSTSFEADQTKSFMTESGKPLYVTRKSSGTNPYRLYINTYLPETATSFGGSAAIVSMQDAKFKNNTVQVVDRFPYYGVKTEATEVFTGQLSTDKKFTVPINIDTHIYSKMGTMCYSSKAVCANSARWPILWYADTDKAFTEDIKVAKVYFYMLSNTTAMLPELYNIYDIGDELYAFTQQATDAAKLGTASYNSFQATEELKTMFAATALFSDDNLIAECAPSAVGQWFSADITDFVKAHYSDTDRKPIGLTLRPKTDWGDGNGIPSLGYKNYSSGSTANNPSYIEVMGPVESLIVEKNHTAVTCSPKTSAIISRQELQYAAPDYSTAYNLTANNIVYVLSKAPTKGVVTCNGLPVIEGRSFTQAEINVGAVCYFNTETASADSFVLEVGDYTGSVVLQPQTVTVNIR